MIKDIIDILKDTFLRHKGVKTFKYQEKAYNNAQNNHKALQVYVVDTSYHQFNLTTNLLKVEFEIYVLGQPEVKDDPDMILEIQDKAYTVACDAMAYIDEKDEYQGILDVYDYSIIVLSHYSDDDSSGVHLSLVLTVPSPVSLCTLDDNFNDEPYPEDPDEPEVEIETPEPSEDIDITPIKLPRRPC